MAESIPITENTAKLNDLKALAESLPDKNSTETTELSATQSKVLFGETFIGVSGIQETGTMPNRGTTYTNKTITSNTSYSIPAGYHESGTININISGTSGSGGIDTSDATAQGKHILKGKTAYAKGQQITGTIPTKTSSDITIQQDEITIPSGYYESNMEKKIPSGILADPIFTTTDNGANKLTITAKNQVETAGYISLNSQHTDEIIINPAEFSLGVGNNQVKYNVETAGYVSKGSYGSVSLSSFDSDFKESNIKKGVSIFGITGTYSGDIITEELTVNVQAPSLSLSLSPTHRFSSLYSLVITSLSSKEEFYYNHPDEWIINDLIYNFKLNKGTANSFLEDGGPYADNYTQHFNCYSYHNVNHIIAGFDMPDSSSKTIAIRLDKMSGEYFGGNYFVMLVGSL